MVMVLYRLHFLFIHQIVPNLITTYNRFMLLLYMVELLSELYRCSTHVQLQKMIVNGAFLNFSFITIFADLQ